MGGLALTILIVGGLALITAIKGNTSQVISQFDQDLFGSGSGTGFLMWAGAILFVAIMGNILHIPRASKMFVVLILVVYILQQNGLWANVTTAFSSTSAPAPTPTADVGQSVSALDVPNATTSAPAQSSGGSSVSTAAAGATASTSTPAAAPPSPPSWVPSIFGSIWK